MLLTKPHHVDLDFAKNSANLYTNPNLENIINTVKSGFPDPLMGQHKMSGTYSNPSTANDLIEAGSKAVLVGNTKGTAVL